VPTGRKTYTGTPRPTARASEAQEPEPRPEKQREALREGESLGGQAPLGKETRTGFLAAAKD